ncbi:hypothetical protein [Embleya scabrispora]|uniref:hypothetical protein n=1 Tax=Embleya scabrispora TaxID=159449 RepID=UPI000374064D|nr:hypothetical protein [Embleya scabrispora]MYS80637.1 hypothetical protein [Streptomyces sp. SID5474]
MTALLPGDRALLATAHTVNTWTRAGLCTLARHGAAVRRDHPERADALADALACWPLYKAGQFLFDLLEWEDFMLDGDPPPPLPLGEAVNVAGVPLRRLRRLAAGGAIEAPGAVRAPTAEELPPLDAGTYLYRDVMIGALTALALLMPHQPPRSPAAPEEPRS